MEDPSACTADPGSLVPPPGQGAALQGVTFLFWAQGAGAEQGPGPGPGSGKTEAGTVTDTQCARH